MGTAPSTPRASPRLSDGGERPPPLQTLLCPPCPPVHPASLQLSWRPQILASRILSRSLAPRSRGSDVYCGGVACGLCLSHFSLGWANVTSCCGAHLCTECFLAAQTAALAKSCPWCRAPAYDVSVVLAPRRSPRGASSPTTSGGRPPAATHTTSVAERDARDACISASDELHSERAEEAQLEASLSALLARDAEEEAAWMEAAICAALQMDVADAAASMLRDAPRADSDDDTEEGTGS